MEGSLEKTQQDLNDLHMALLSLRTTVEALVIVQDGIQELEGVHLKTYGEAEQHLKRRAMRYRADRENEVRRAEIEVKIKELNDELEYLK